MTFTQWHMRRPFSTGVLHQGSFLMFFFSVFWLTPPKQFIRACFSPLLILLTLTYTLRPFVHSLDSSVRPFEDVPHVLILFLGCITPPRNSITSSRLPPRRRNKIVSFCLYFSRSPGVKLPKLFLRFFGFCPPR